MLLGTLGTSLLGNILVGKGVNKKGKGIIRAAEGAIAKCVSEETESKRQGRGIVKAGYGNKKCEKKNKVYF